MSAEKIDPNLIIPKPQTARVFGVLHILYGIVFCFIAYTSALMLMFAPIGTDLLKAWMSGIGDMVAQQNRVQTRRLERLKELATSDEQRAKYDQRLAALQAMPNMNGLRDMPMGTEALEDPTLRGYSIMDVVINLPINMLMIIGGVGLLQLREWGRKWSWWSSILKVAALALGVVYMVVVIYPIQSKMVVHQLEAQQKFQASLMKGAPPPGLSPFNAQSNSLIAASSTLSGLFVLGLFAAYPITSLFYLNRRTIRAACWKATALPDDVPAQPDGGSTP